MVSNNWDKGNNYCFGDLPLLRLLDGENCRSGDDETRIDGGMRVDGGVCVYVSTCGTLRWRGITRRGNNDTTQSI